VNRYEKIIRVPSITITQAAGVKISEQLHILAEQRTTAELQARLGNLYRSNPAQATLMDPGARDELAFVQRNITNNAYRQLLYPAYAEKYTFLSRHGNVMFVGNDFELKDIPRDVDGVVGRADGPQTEFIDINLKARFDNYNDLIDRNNNRVIIQGNDSEWVNDVYEKINQAVSPEKNPVRDILYRYLVAWTWLTYGLVLLLEYRIARFLIPGFGFRSPLNGLAVLVIFLFLFLNVIAVTQFFIRVVGYLYPFFEFDANLSRGRTAYRKPVALAITALYGAVIVALFKLH
jgi:hypothetical protein